MIALSQLAKLLGAKLVHFPGLEETSSDPAIDAVSSIRQAAPGTLVFAEDEASFAAALASPAAAVLVSPEVSSEVSQRTSASQKPWLLCAQPRLAFCRAAKLLGRPGEPVAASFIHPMAAIAQSARLDGGVSVGAYAVLEENVQVGYATVIGSGAFIGHDVVIGRGCHIYPRAVLYAGTTLGDSVIVHAGAVLGGDGFGYVREPDTGEYLPFPQQGKLVIEDHVEIGANSTIDRGALEETRIGRGAKIDNLVHIGHNVCIGRNAVIAAQTGISGSSTVGNDAVLGGQVGIGDHASVGDGVLLGGQAGILPHKKLHGPGILFWGTPAQPVKRYLRQLAALGRLGRSPQEAQTKHRRRDEPLEDPATNDPAESSRR